MDLDKITTFQAVLVVNFETRYLRAQKEFRAHIFVGFDVGVEVLVQVVTVHYRYQ